MSVVEDFSNFYRNNAEKALSVTPGAPGAIDLPKSGVIEDDFEGDLSRKAVTRVADHFKQQDFKGAKRYFIAVATQHDGVEGSEIFFYDLILNVVNLHREEFVERQVAVTQSFGFADGLGVDVVNRRGALIRQIPG